MEEAVWSSYIGGGIWRGLFGGFILVEGYNKGWRGPFGALIIGEGYGEACSEQLYQREDIIRDGESCLKLLYWRRNLERPVWSIYISGGI